MYDKRMKVLASLPIRGSAAGWQVVLVVAAWVYLCSLHWNNDGLWYQGDAPRHAANGLFWKDYLLSPTVNLKEYALSYYARYPVINLLGHPPVFHLLEGVLFAVFGPSPYVAKGLVLCFALLAGLYTLAWLRLRVADEAGWGAPLLLLLPGVVYWSHAIMLNVPAFALGIAALYHARRWLESSPPQARSAEREAQRVERLSEGAPRSALRAARFAAVLSLLAVLTYFTAGVVVLVMLAWLIALRRWQLLGNARTLVILMVAALPLLPCLVVVFVWAPTHVSWVIPAAWQLEQLATWTYYPSELPSLCSPHLLVLAAVGMVAGLISAQWRREVLLLLVWLAVIYLFFSLLPAKEARYVLLASGPVVFLCMIALVILAQRIAAFAKWQRQTVRCLCTVAIVILLGVQVGLAPSVNVPSLEGMREMVQFLETVDPDEPLFYDGHFDGVFAFHVQAGDPDYRRRVVLGGKLLYASAVVPGWRLREFVSTPEEVIAALRTRGGCRWLAIEVGESSEQVASARLLRKVIEGPHFKQVRSFPIGHPKVERVDVYRLLLPVDRVEEVDLAFPILGETTTYRVRPIATRK